MPSGKLLTPLLFWRFGCEACVSDHPFQETAKNRSSKAGVETGITVFCFTTLCFQFETMPVLWLLIAAQHKYTWTFLHIDMCACVCVVRFLSGG